MFELFDSNPNQDVLESEYVRLLGFPVGKKLDGRSLEIANLTREWYREHGSPWIYAREIQSLDLSDSGFRLDGDAFECDFLQRTLRDAEAETAIVVAVSAGEECVARSAELWKEQKPDEYFFMEMFGGAMVEHLITRAGAKLCEWADPQGLLVLPHYSPGYPEWDVAQQVTLLDVVKRGVSKELPGSMTILESGMLMPKKSLLAVFGVTRQVEKAKRVGTLIPCESCSLPGCSYRRKPYFLDTMNDLANPEEELEEKENQPAAIQGIAPLALDAKYSISGRALRKWAETRLSLVPTGSEGFEAVFTYDGTTCSNMGHPLRYLYRISIGGPETGYQILNAECRPEEKDEGHKKQCEFLKGAAKLTQAIREEQPLVGERIDSVLQWQHPSSPAGCFCEASSRNHKWTIAYEVLHFALAQKERERRASA